MCAPYDCSGGCSWWTCLVFGVAWWLIASVLLLLTWNKVVAAIATVKQAKFWHAVLVVLTFVVLLGPLCCGLRGSSGSGPCGDPCGSAYDCSGKCGTTCDPKLCDPGACDSWKKDKAIDE